ncbi:MAG: hypothetical protein FJX75_21875 [Armatimonadetes bacterium]|nr:hypothetical protein [Armatimonadota bacterium]
MRGRWRFDRIGDYVKAAPKRLDDARELLEAPTWGRERGDAAHRHLRAAVYLAGYVVECSLKAYIISRVPGARSFEDAIRRRAEEGETGLDFTGRRAHDLRALRRATDLDPVLDQSDDIREAWGRCQKWDPDWRYDPSHFTSRREAGLFVEAAATLHTAIELARTSELEV